MAVQAECPSNVLLLNRNAQERKNMFGGEGESSLQLQAGDMIQQSQMLYGNGDVAEEVNTRKRMREITVSAAETNANLFQHLSPTIYDLYRIQNQTAPMVSTGLRLASADQKPYHYQQQQQTGFVLPSSAGASSAPKELAALIMQQNHEVDQILLTQGLQLRQAVAEQQRKYQRLLLAAAKQSATLRMREKEAEAEKAIRRRTELEEQVARLAEAARAWQARARARDEDVAALQAQLQRAVTTTGFGVPHITEAEELGHAGAAEDAESAHVDPVRCVSGAPVCRACRNRPANVLLLPCRHLCLCNGCGATVDACPACGSARSATMEVYLC